MSNSLAHTAPQRQRRGVLKPSRKAGLYLLCHILQREAARFPFPRPETLYLPAQLHPARSKAQEAQGGPAPPGVSLFYCLNLQCNVLPASWLRGAYINYPASAISCLSRLIVSIKSCSGTVLKLNLKSLSLRNP